MVIESRTDARTPTRAVPMDEFQGLLQELETTVRFEALGAAFQENLARRLGALEQALARRYDGEPRSALYQDVPKGTPRYSRQLDALRAEHRRLLRWAHHLAALSQQPGEPAFVAGLRSETRGLLEALAHHERRERMLLAEALSTDIGVGD